jgi:hypothetical protein
LEAAVQQRIEEPNGDEQGWLASCIESAFGLVKTYTSTTESIQRLNPSLLDRTFAAWLAAGETDNDRINHVINAIGFAFGQLLVEAAGFRWVVASDQYGCEMAVLALPGRGDVLIYPANMVAKRWLSKETGFLAPLFDVITNKVRELEADHPAT